MIAWLEGVLREKAPTRIVVDVQGVGYELLIPLSTFGELPDPGKTVSLQVHTHVREDALQLFGFASALERATFELLIKASRVGPKLAQTILSGISARVLVGAIRDGEVGVLRSVPGIGAKMAERIVVELRDRAGELCGAKLGPETSASADPSRGSSVERDQVLSALVNLGYPRARAERVSDAAAEEAGEGASIETLIRIALRRLGT
jgi:Holliday junction DNA helicase RuvA